MRDERGIRERHKEKSEVTWVTGKIVSEWWMGSAYLLCF